MTLKTAIFMTPTELTKYVNDPVNGVTVVVSITFDSASGKYVLFFTS
jgi:hypothetical protein